MEGSILSTYMFGILVLLLIIVIIVMYYLWNETKKNKNTITMLESDLEAIRGRLEKTSKHIEELESFEMAGGDAGAQMGMGKMHPSKLMQQQNILEHLMGGLGMRDFMHSGDSEEGSDEGSDEDEEDEEDEDEDEDEQQEDDEDDEDEEQQDEGSNEESEYETVDEEEQQEEEECDACGDAEAEEEEVEHDVLPEEPATIEPPFIPVISTEMNDHINNILGELNIDGVNNKKFPAKTPSECEVGDVLKGGDSKDYVVALNKRGGKYWKPLK